MSQMPSSLEELMLAVSKGDLDAFEQIVLRCQTLAWSAAYRFLGDAAEAEDVAQEAFLKILDASGRYRPKGAFRTYLYRVVTRLCLDRVRKKQPFYAENLSVARDHSPSPLEAMAQRERDEAIRSALDELPPKQRMAIVLRHYGGLRVREIASAMGTSGKAVERLLARARASLEVLLAYSLGK